MNNYHFNILSPLRFEQLVRDLLQGEYGDFENFAEGIDGGIDFRYSHSKTEILLVQCKRYKTVRSLISGLKKEKDKLRHLDFTDYLLVVSLDLTPSNKEQIIKLYDGKIQHPGKIVTSGDLNALLGRYSNYYIEFKYPELWMNSINVHQKIFNLGFLNHSEFIKEKIKDSLINFVPHRDYDRLINHYKVHNTAIISGNPGIGKTTLSHAIIAHFIFFEKYQLIDLSYRKIQEAESFLYTQDPVIFLVDDFLGKIKLEKDNDHIQLLLYFIEKIETTKNKKIVITSREYILRKASTEIFSANEIAERVFRYVIEIKSLTRRIRTEILYNHLKNGALHGDFIDNFLENDFKKIIDHKNYSPRIIQHLTNVKLLNDIQAKEYYDFFLQNLDKPDRIWEMVYNNLPNDLYKLILLVRFLISEKISVDNFEKSIQYFLEKDKFKQYGYDDFYLIIREMEGTFFSFSNDYDEISDEEISIIEFQNPSIIDFIDAFIWKRKDWLKLIIENAIYYEQIFNYDLLEVIKSDESLLQIFRDRIVNDFSKLTNSGFGFFEYDAPDEGTFDCWIPGRRLYYLEQASLIIDDWDLEFAHFLKKEILKYEFDGTESLSEKISFFEIAERLLYMGIVTGQSIVQHYINGFCCDHIKELVFLEYMTRACDQATLDMIRKSKKLVRESDELFLNEVEKIDKMSFSNILDFYDDYNQVKFILPLTKTTKRLKKINSMEKLRTAHKRRSSYGSEESRRIEIDENYNDIEDDVISQFMKNIVLPGADA